MSDTVYTEMASFTNHHSYMDYSIRLLSYQGLVTENMIAELGNVIKKLFFHNPRVCGKLFSIFIETATNVYNYSDEKVLIENGHESVGSFEITQNTESYLIKSTNMVNNGYLSELQEGCEIINSFDRDGLRTYKREQRNMPPKKRSKGAGIGLIQIALIADNQLSLKVQKASNDFSYIELSVEIKK